MKAKKILFVCTGNTCRSAMASVIMNDIAQKNDLNILIDSAGIFASVGQKATDEAIAVMNELNIDLSAHRAKPLTDHLMDMADIILTMTNAHKQLIEQAAVGKVFTLKESVGQSGDIIDPYGGDLDQYRATANEIYELLVDLSQQLSVNKYE